MIDGTKEMTNLLEEIKRNMDSDGYFVDETNASFYLGALWILSSALAKKEMQRRPPELVEQRAKLEKEADEEQKGG